jgi:ComEC/Rec2-related protein
MIFASLYNKLEEEYHNLPIWYFVSFMLGIIYFFSCAADVTLRVIIFSASLPIALICAARIWRSEHIIIKFVSYIMLMFCIGLFASYVRTSLNDTHPIQVPIVTNIEGVVENIKPSLRGLQVTIVDITAPEESLHKVRINLSHELLGEIIISKGDRIALEVRLFPLSHSVLPGSFDFGFYMYLSAIEATGFALSKPVIISVHEAKLDNLMQYIRQVIYKRLIEVMGADTGNFTAAILIGETKAIPPDIANNMRDTGVAHILSVSGLHLSLVAMIFFVASRFVLNCFDYIAYNFNVKNIAALLSILGSFGYLHVSGSNIAAMRAFIMTFIFILSVIFGRSLSPMRSIAVAAFLILLFLPEYILHPSFQLSFSAVLCLISGYELYVKNAYLLGNSKGIFAQIKLYLASNIYSSAIASIVTAPYVIFHFYKFATHSIAMNLIAVPIMSFFMMPLALLALLVMPLGIDGPILKLLGWFVSLVIDSAHHIVQWPYAVLYLGHISGLSLLLFTFGFFWLAFWQSGWRIYGVVIIAISCVMMAVTPRPLLVYDHKFGILGAQDKQGRLEIFTEHPLSQFTQEYWSTWYGQASAKMHIIPMRYQDYVLELKDGRSVSFNFHQCHDADIMLIVSRKLQCDGEAFRQRQIIPNKHLRKQRQIAIY